MSAPATGSAPAETAEGPAKRVPGGRVTLHEVEPGSRRIETQSRFPIEKPNRARLAVRVDGVLRGHLHLPKGFGERWRASSLGDGRPGASAYSVRVPLDLWPPGGAALSRDEIAALFVGWAAEGRAPSQEEMDAAHAEAVSREAEQAARRLEERRAEDEHWTEVKRRIRADEAAAEAARAERRRVTVDGLRSLLARGRATMTNGEVAALENAIEDAGGG